MLPTTITESATCLLKAGILSKKGDHAAVDKPEHFVRQHKGDGWYLQLDIHNFFNTMHRPALYAMLCKQLSKTTQRSAGHAPPVRPEPVEGFIKASTSSAQSVGNTRLRWLASNDALALRSLSHRLLANTVTEQVRDAAAAARLPASKRLVNAKTGCGLRVGNRTTQFFANVYLNALDQYVKHTLKCKHHCYRGHFAHCNSMRPRQALFARFAWLKALFLLPSCGELQGRWVLQGETFATQAAALQAQWPGAQCQIQKCCQWVDLPLASPATPYSSVAAQPTRVRAAQTGWLHHGTRRCEIADWFIPHSILP